MPFIISIVAIIAFFYIKNNPSVLGPMLLILLGIVGVIALIFYITSKQTRKCNICDKVVPYLESITSNQGAVICYTCLQQAGYTPKANLQVTAARVIQKIQAREMLNEYTYTHNIGNYIAINQNNKTWSPFPFNKIYKYNDLIDYEVIENGKTVYSSISTKGAGGIGRAAIGGLLFGGAGAVVGAVTAKSTTETESSNIIDDLKIKIIVNDMDTRNVIIDMEYKGSANSSDAHFIKNTVQDITSTLDIIKNSNVQEHLQQNSLAYKSQADEISKFKKLLDEGAITQEEYEKMKKQILS